MATIRWRGDAPAIAQTGTLTPGGTIEVGDLFNVTINNKTVQYAATGTTVASVTAGLATALEASTIPEFAEITWEDGTTVVNYTGPSTGKPISLSVTTTESGGGAADAQTFADATVLSASSPNHWNVGANWSGGSVPTSSDDVYIENSDVSIKYGLDQNAVTLTSLNIGASYTGNIGLPYTNEDADSYIEYRDRYLKIKATTVNIGYGTGSGSAFINLDNSDAQTTLNLQNTASSTTTNRQSMQWKGTHASNVLNLSKGIIGIAVEPGEAATIATLNIGYRSAAQSDVDCIVGSGATLTTVNKSGGDLSLFSGATTVTNEDGFLYVEAGGVTTLNVQGGNVVWNSTGTLTTGYITGQGHLDFSQDLRTKTVTNALELYGNQSKLSDPHKVIATRVIDLNYRSTLEGLNIGTNNRLTITTPS